MLSCIIDIIKFAFKSLPLVAFPSFVVALCIVVKGALKACLGPRQNHSLVIVAHLPRHAPCWIDVSKLLHFYFLNIFILEILTVY